MSKNYNSTLQINNTDLQTILNTINELPNAGSSLTPILQNKTVTPTTDSQTVTADSGYDGLDTVTVNAIPSIYVKPTATKAATTYTPTTFNRTISAGTYCSGAQTIKGDANLKAENIAEGVSIFGVTGTYSSSSEIKTANISIKAITSSLKRIYYIDGRSNTYSSTGQGGYETTITYAVRGSFLIVASMDSYYLSTATLECEGITLVGKGNYFAIFFIPLDQTSGSCKITF